MISPGLFAKPVFFGPAPKVKRVSKSEIPKHMVRTVVRDVKGGVELQIAREVASEPDGR